MFHSVLVSQKMFVGKLRSFEESVRTRTPEALRERINIICTKDMIVEYW